MAYGVCSQKGSKAENQDAWLARISKESSGRGGLFVVCDGVGSSECGGEAARLSCLRLGEMFEKKGELSGLDFEERLVEIDWELRGRGRGVALCTVALIWLHGEEAYLFSMGDTDIFHLTEEGANRLNQHRDGGGLRGCLGMGFNTTSAFLRRHFKVNKGDVFCLLSDGVVRGVSTDELSATWLQSEGSPDQCAESLVRKARNSGESDDLTALIVLIGEV